MNREVRAYELDGQYVGVWRNRKLAAIWADCRSHDIYRCCIGERSIAGGFRWEWA